MAPARLDLGGAGMRSLVAAIAGLVAVALCGVAVIQRARTSDLPVRMLAARGAQQRTAGPGPPYPPPGPGWEGVPARGQSARAPRRKGDSMPPFPIPLPPPDGGHVRAPLNEEGAAEGEGMRAERKVATPLRYAIQPAAQSLKGRSGTMQSAASIGFQPGVGVDYPGYEPPGDPRLEGSDAMTYEPWARNAEMRKRAGWDVGETGWEPGPDYYSTRKYDNLETYPSSAGTGMFRPYMGPTGCDNCDIKQIDGTYVFSVNAQCDNSVQTKNVKSVLRPWDPFRRSAFENRRYEDLVWSEQQLSLLPYFFKKLTILIPPCFFPHFSSKAMAMLDNMVYMRATNLLIVGGHSGADFISRFLAGEDGNGYVRSWHRDPYSLPKSRMDVVWTEGPFMMQEAATSTEFYFGHRILRNVGNCIVGVPVKDLPANTKHYYMDQDENSVIFEIPAGYGRVMFFGYDMCNNVPDWIDTLLLAQSELMQQKLPPPPPPAPYIPLPPKVVVKPPAAPAMEDMPTGLNYYCALYKRNAGLGAPKALLDKYLKKCQGQDCDNNRALDQNDATGLFDFCKWTDENGLCYLHEPAVYCYRSFFF